MTDETVGELIGQQLDSFRRVILDETEKRLERFRSAIYSSVDRMARRLSKVEERLGEVGTILAPEREEEQK